MRRSFRPGRNWRPFSFTVVCERCSRAEQISFTYHCDDQVARIMYAAKAGWGYEPYQHWFCPEHKDNDVAP